MRRLVLMAALCPTVLRGQALSFASGWDLTGDARLDTLNRVPSVRMETGRATRRDVSFQDGTIDLDVMLTDRRSFVYVGFRMRTDEDHEEFYLRPHKSNLPDATQYAPVFQGRSAWQLYHGPGGTSPIGFAPNVWTHLRVVLSGRQAALFVGDTIKPALIVPRLAHDPAPGHIAVYGFLPAGVPGSGPIARFANVRVRQNVIAFKFPAATVPTPVPGAIRAWTVGAPFATSDSARTTFDPQWLSAPRRLETSPSGLLELHRLVKTPDVPRDVGIAARAYLIADSAGTYRLDLGFSDAVTVFLNGKPIYYADQQYDYLGRREGLIGYHQATLFLPLRAGRNELAALVTDHFGGWGLMAKLAPGVRAE
jgi:hypothetical protein